MRRAAPLLNAASQATSYLLGGLVVALALTVFATSLSLAEIADWAWNILGLTFAERESAAKLDAESYNSLLLDLRAKIAETGQAELAELISGDDESAVDVVSGNHIGQLVQLRGECRNYKQYALADQIRDWLDSQGISVEDSASGSIWLYSPNS